MSNKEILRNINIALSHANRVEDQLKAIYVSGLEVDDFSLNADDEEDYEIIGNIHQNPELLGEKDVD